MTKKQNTKTNRNRPAFHVFHVREGQTNQDKFWTRIGVAWKHSDGDGISLELDLVPLDGKLVLRRPKESAE